MNFRCETDLKKNIDHMYQVYLNLFNSYFEYYSENDFHKQETKCFPEYQIKPFFQAFFLLLNSCKSEIFVTRTFLNFIIKMIAIVSRNPISVVELYYGSMS